MINEELAVLIQQGQQEYIPELYRQIEKLITSKARAYYNKFYEACARCGITSEDIAQEGYFIMLEAVRGFKPEAGLKFTAYLSFPFKNHFAVLTGHKTSRREPLNDATSLDEPLSAESESFTLGDIIEDENSEAEFDEVLQGDYQQALHIALEKGMDQMVPEQRMTIQCRYFEKQTLQKTAEKIGCSREQARQHEQKALRIFRKPKISRTLRSFLYDEMESYSLHGTGISAFRNTGVSSTERTFEHMEDIKKRGYKDLRG